MILQAVTNVEGVSELCLSYFALGGILFLGIGLGFAVCTIFNNNPRTGLLAKLLSNGQALGLIQNYKDLPKDASTTSGRLEVGPLLAYIDEMKSQCKSVGKPLSGLEYFFANYGDSGLGDEGRSTILIYPTYYNGLHANGTEMHIPFDPFLPFDNGNPISVASMNSIPVAQRKGGTNDPWYDSTHVLNRSNMSPPREPLTF